MATSKPRKRIGAVVAVVTALLGLAAALVTLLAQGVALRTATLIAQTSAGASRGASPTESGTPQATASVTPPPVSPTVIDRVPIQNNLIGAVTRMCSGDCGPKLVPLSNGGVHFKSEQTNPAMCPRFTFPSGYTANVWDGYAESDVTSAGIVAHVCEVSVYRTT